MIINVNKTTIKLSNPEVIALYLLSKEYSMTPTELARRMVMYAPDDKTTASFIRDYLTLNLIRRVLQWK